MVSGRRTSPLLFVGRRRVLASRCPPKASWCRRKNLENWSSRAGSGRRCACARRPDVSPRGRSPSGRPCREVLTTVEMSLRPVWTFDFDPVVGALAHRRGRDSVSRVDRCRRPWSGLVLFIGGICRSTPEPTDFVRFPLRFIEGLPSWSKPGRRGRIGDSSPVSRANDQCHSLSSPVLGLCRPSRANRPCPCGGSFE